MGDKEQLQREEDERYEQIDRALDKASADASDTQPNEDDLNPEPADSDDSDG